jgi:dienelactone hydrolase
MRDRRLDPDDIAGIARAYRWLIEQPFVDPARSGLLGTCVGGSFALMAAADPHIRDRVSFVVAWAPYASMRSLGRDIASATRSSGDGRAPWDVDPLTRDVFVRTLTAGLAPDDAHRLRHAFAAGNGQLDADSLSPDGRAVAPLLTVLDARAAEAAVDRLPAALRERLDAMSPLGYLPDIRAPLTLLAHDRDDQVIPIGESRRLRAALGGRAGVRSTEFTMFKHLDPTKVRLPRWQLVRELARFYLAVYPIFRQTIGP